MRLYAVGGVFLVLFAFQNTSARLSGPYKQQQKHQQERRLNDGAFIESNGLIVMEAESIDFLPDVWKMEAYVAGYTGYSYLRFDGNTIEKGPPNGILNYPFIITNPGVYQLSIRANKNNTADPTVSNDCYTRLVASDGSELMPFTKTYVRGTPNFWNWNTNWEFASGEHPVPTFTFAAGASYKLQVAGRSKHYVIDRLVLFQPEFVQEAFAESLGMEESARQDTSLEEMMTSPMSNPTVTVEFPIAPPPVPAPVPAPVPVPVPAPISQAPVVAPTAGLSRSAFLPLSTFPSTFIDAGTESEDESIIGGDYWMSKFPANITGIPPPFDVVPEAFQTHRSGTAFNYTLTGFLPNTPYVLTLGWAENYAPLCRTGRRIFHVKVNGVFFVNNWDVYWETNQLCNTGLVVSKIVTADANGVLLIDFLPLKQNPMVSVIGVDKVPPEPTVAPVAAPTITTTSESVMGTTSGAYIDDFCLVDATDKDVILASLVDGMVLYLDMLPPTLSAIVKAPSQAVTRVRFQLQGTTQNEGNPPYTLAGKAGTGIRPAPILSTVGTHTILITIFGATGRLETRSVTFTVVEQSPSSLPKELPADVVFIDAGSGSAEEEAYIEGNTWVSQSTTAVSGVPSQYAQSTLQTHRSGQAPFSYLIPGFLSEEMVEITLGFAETSKCVVGERVFDILVNGLEFMTDFDVFKTAGCNAALMVRGQTTALSDGSIEFEFLKKVQNPMVSFISIVRMGTDTPTAGPVVAPTTASPVETVLTSTPTVITTGAPSPAPTTSNLVVEDEVVLTTSYEPYILINAGSTDDSEGMIKGNVWVSGTSVEILGAPAGFPMEFFQSHRTGQSPFLYTIGGFDPYGLANVTLGFAEIYEPNCDVGMRVISVDINQIPLLSNIDVFDMVGCFTALVVNGVFQANGNGEFDITLTAIKQNPMISLIGIDPLPANIEESSALPGTVQLDENVFVEASLPGSSILISSAMDDLGSFGRIIENNTDSWTFPQNISGVPPGLDPALFQTHRAASVFTYVIDGYEPFQLVGVTIGFAENYEPNCVQGKRIFDVEVNGGIFEHDLDVFRTVGCNAALVITKPFAADVGGSFSIAFYSVKRDPIVSFIAIDTEYATPLPTGIPSLAPSSVPTLVPSTTPTTQPSEFPSETPSRSPISPSSCPSSLPSDSPSNAPSSLPSDSPSSVPSDSPSLTPSFGPSSVPTISTTESPSDIQSLDPTASLIQAPIITSAWLVQSSTKEIVLPLVNGAIYDLSEVGTDLTILVETTPVAFVQFRYANLTQTEGNAPYVLGGKMATTAYWPVDYLAEVGQKVVQVDAYLPDGSFGQRIVLSFTISSSRTDAPSSAPSATPVIEAMTLVDAITAAPIMPLSMGSSYDISEVGTTELSILVETSSINYVRFQYDNQMKTEGSTPYVLGGKNSASGGYYPVEYLAYPGTKTITIDAFHADNFVLQHVDLSFTVTQSSEDLSTAAEDTSIVPEEDVKESTTTVFSVENVPTEQSSNITSKSISNVTANTYFNNTAMREVIIDAGSPTAETSLVSGKAWASISMDGIDDVPEPFSMNSFQSHLSGYAFNYTISGFMPNVSALVQIGFAENYEPNCEPNMRVFDVLVNGEVFESNLDVFATTGKCFSALVISKPFTASSAGDFVIEFSPVQSNPMVSLIAIVPQIPQMTTSVAGPSQPVPTYLNNITLVKASDRSPIMELNDGDSYDGTLILDELSLVVDAIESVSQVRFRWNGLAHTEGNRPFAMDGKSGSSNYKTVPYLSAPGLNQVIIELLDADGSILETHELSFWVDGAVFTAAQGESSLADLIINAGSEDEDPDMMDGSVWNSYFPNNISNVPSGIPMEYLKYHRSGYRFNYTLDGYSPYAVLDLSLMFAENYEPNCVNGKRIFSVDVNGEVFAHNIDVHGSVGCFSGYRIDGQVQADDNGSVLIEFLPVKRHPMVSVITVTSAGIPAYILPSDIPSLVPSDAPSQVPIGEQSSAPTGTGYIAGYFLVDADDRSIVSLVNDGDVVILSTIEATSLSLVVDVLDPENSAVNYVRFRWQGIQNVEGSAPYAMNGKNTAAAFHAVDYLQTPGFKTIMVEVFDLEQTVLHSHILSFTVKQ